MMEQPVFLVGAPAEVGRVQGELQGEVLRERIGRILQRAENTNTVAILRERADRLGEKVTLAAPHWLTESEALCRAANVELWQMLALNSLPPDFWGQSYVPPPYTTPETSEAIVTLQPQSCVSAAESECTAFFALGPATQNGATLFHKNRDERDEVQWLGIKALENCHRWIGGSDIGHLGIAQLYAEGHWAGANNSGSSIVPQEYEDCALNDGHVLRYVAERCAGLDEIVLALEDLMARQLLGGAGLNTGMIFLFADAERGLAIECTSRHLAHEWFTGEAMGARTNHFLIPTMQEFALPPTIGSLRRLERARELWEAQAGHATLDLCDAIACDRTGAPQAGIARNPSDGLGTITTSTATATLTSSGERGGHFQVRNGHPAFTPPVVLTLLEHASDMELVSGSYNQVWRAQRGNV